MRKARVENNGVDTLVSIPVEPRDVADPRLSLAVLMRMTRFESHLLARLNPIYEMGQAMVCFHTDEITNVHTEKTIGRAVVPHTMMVVRKPADPASIIEGDECRYVLSHRPLNGPPG